MKETTKTKKIEILKSNIALWNRYNKVFQQYHDLSSANLSSADLNSADLNFSNLSSANLSDANLRDANLSSANLDYSSGFSLSCRGSYFKADLKLVRQYLAHLCTIEVSDEEKEEFEEIKKSIIKQAQKSHRAKDLRLID